MAKKSVHVFLLITLQLCLATFEVGAEESTLLIDNRRGIDNTRSPASQEMENLKIS